jgi:hypothetical protein
MRPKVFIVGGDMLISRMFMDNNWEVIDSIEDADLIQFTGGEDVSPMLYGEVKHPRTYCNPSRDQKEADVFFKHFETAKAGICRGGQFLNVMSGGFMHQDVDNHAIGGTHEATYDDGRTFQVTSTHHQMMQHQAVSSTKLFLTADLSTRKEDENGFNTKEFFPIDVEGVFYGHSNSLCFQPHPEYTDPEHECQRLYFEVLKRFFNLEVK